MIVDNLVSEAIETLEKNRSEWLPRWTGWANSLLDNQKDIQKARSKFRVRSPLRVYLPVSEAMKSKRRCFFSLRYFGNDVGAIEVDFEVMKPKLYLDDREHKDNYRLRKRIDLGLLPQEGKRLYPWNSKPASDFRKHFDNLNPSLYEHNLEAMILDEMENNYKEKFQGTLRNIQPVQLYKKFCFQMKIPFSANKGDPKYSGTGGGIDILARVGRGHGTDLAVLEIKMDKRESYKKALLQSIIYSVGLLQLLRQKNVGNMWWELFGYSRDLPESLTIHAAPVIPHTIRDEFHSELKNLGLKDDSVINVGEDEIRIGHIFFEPTSENGIIINDVGGFGGRLAFRNS